MNLPRMRAPALALAAVACIAGAALPARAGDTQDRTVPTPARQVERRPGQAAVRQEAESGGLRVVRQLDAQRWQPGSPITMTLRATAPAGAAVRMPALGDSFGPFDVRPAPRPAPEAGTESVAAVLVAWDAGTLEVPATEATARLADGSEAKVTIPAVTIELTSLLGEGVPLTELASEVRGPVEIGTGHSWIWWIAACAIAVAALAFVWWLRSRGARRVPEPPLPPAEWARRELDRLENEGLPQRGEVDGFFMRLSAIMRTYIEGRFLIAAPDRTTQEFLREASGHAELAGDRARELGRFLRAADLVKFAAARPPADACAEAMRSMREFVESTAPRPEDTGGQAVPPKAEAAQ